MEKALINFKRILDLAQTDPEYLRLDQELSETCRAVLSLLERLSNEDRCLLMDYLGTYSTRELRMVELACLYMEFPPQD